MIYTVTFNPAIDYVIKVDNLTLGQVNRTTREYIFCGGKGINVSHLLLLNQERKNLDLNQILSESVKE